MGVPTLCEAKRLGRDVFPDRCAYVARLLLSSTSLTMHTTLHVPLRAKLSQFFLEFQFFRTDPYHFAMWTDVQRLKKQVGWSVGLDRF